MADCGVDSRRKCENIILEGRVQINGKTVTELGSKVNPTEDIVAVDEKVIDPMSIDKVYIILNKPRGYVSTVTDPEGRKTVMDLVWGNQTRVFPVGRLDYLSEGLMILTNDGDLANKILHPSYEVTKVYEVKVFGHVDDGMLARMRKGVMTEDGLMKPASVRLLEQLPNKTWIEFRLNEGKNREIRKICEALDLTVDKLRRVAIEELTIQGLPLGKFAFISKKELLDSLGINADGTKVAHRKFVSQKKSLPIRRARKQLRGKFKPANDRKYRGFRKEEYYQTIDSIKSVKAEKALSQKST